MSRALHCYWDRDEFASNLSAGGNRRNESIHHTPTKTGRTEKVDGDSERLRRTQVGDGQRFMIVRQRIETRQLSPLGSRER
jgi:hypothetical protein